MREVLHFYSLIGIGIGSLGFMGAGLENIVTFFIGVFLVIWGVSTLIYLND